MRCFRCNGLAYEEHYPTMENGVTIVQTTCANCGYADDPTMAANRLKQQNKGEIITSKHS